MQTFSGVLFTEAELSRGFEIQYSGEYNLKNSAARLFRRIVLNIDNNVKYTGLFS